MIGIDLSTLTVEEKAALLANLEAERTAEASRRKESYESLRQDYILRIRNKAYEYLNAGKAFKEWLRRESEAWFSIMKEYGKLKRDEQMGFTLQDDRFRFQVKGNRVKGFDERADIAEKRLVEFLDEYIKHSEKGVKDPIYKLAMMMIQRNEDGDLDYKSVSRLYELEPDFNDPEYSEIMNLFRESNVVEGCVINFYFEEKNNYNVWRKIEPSFNRM
ncbi:MAG: DUF3164 family protein [Bacteroidales bacterium]|jgi:hypothetical protein|nr:DUF3164 family protein [Bacteroidales bacterium]